MAAKAKFFRLTKQSQDSLVKYVNACCDVTKRFTDLRTKMEFIDIAYARYKANKGDSESNSVSCGAIADEVPVPIVVSEVDSFVGYLADVFLSGYPIFPVVSTPSLRAQAEKLTAVIDNDATLSQYARQFLMNFRDGIKYNFFGLEHSWAPISQYSLASTLTDPTSKAQIAQSQTYINRIQRLDPYNLIWDDTVTPANVSYCGEYAGFTEMVSKIELTRRLRQYELDTGGYNLVEVLGNSSIQSVIGTGLNYYYEPPQISNLISAMSIRNAGTDWIAWLNNERGNQRNYSKLYESVTLYARIIPQEHKITAPQDGTPQIWKLIVINGRCLVCAKRIISAYDMLPILIGQPIEDGFSVQTQSFAENVMKYQEAATTLFSIRFNAARRTVADRALYDANVIKPSDMNNPAPAAKIPFNSNQLLGGKTIDSIYKQIPFDPRGTELTVADIGTVMDFADKTTGFNKMTRGDFQKGNKVVEEVQRAAGGSDNRLRLPALTIEFQVFMPLKEGIKLNILQYQQTGTYQNMKTGEAYALTADDFNKIREANFKFKVADGYTPKSKLASTDFLAQGMTLVGNSPILQQAWGPALPQMFAHLMQLGGVQGLDEYLPEVQPQAQIPGAAQGPIPATPMTPAANVLPIAKG